VGEGTVLSYYESRLNAELYEKFFEEFRTRLFKELKNSRPFFYPFKRILFWGRL
jgi:trans-aconitate 2-methyltransferase